MMRASGSATRSAEPPRTTGRQAVPPSASQALEPLSIESLESLSEPSPPAAPVVSERHSDATARSGATPPPSRSDSVPLTTDAPPSDGPEVEAPVWRVKSDSGLTYCFFSAERLIRWVDGLGPQKHAMVSVDGVNWKAYSDFHGKFEGDVEALAALEAAAEGKPNTQSVTASTTVAGPATQVRPGPKPPARTATQLQPPTKSVQPTRNANRSKTQNTTGDLRRPHPTAERPAVGGDDSSARRPTGAPAESAGWGARVGFMLAGMVLGGASVYFGMYLLGFYDLTSPF